MNIERTGLILYVRNYQECITFYGEILGLEVLFENQDLTCFDLFGSYLMVENEDRQEYLQADSDKGRNFSCIRLNVEDVKSHADHLQGKNVEVDYKEHAWGTVAKFFDPDGNLLAFKDENGFVKQLRQGRNSRQHS